MTKRDARFLFVALVLGTTAGLFCSVYIYDTPLAWPTPVMTAVFGNAEVLLFRHRRAIRG